MTRAEFFASLDKKELQEVEEALQLFFLNGANAVNAEVDKHFKELWDSEVSE
jgi:hypothetical protein